MRDRIRNIILLTLVLQVLVACCRADTYEITITALDSRALILEGGNFVEVEEETTLDKEDLILELLVIEVEEIVLNGFDKVDKEIQVLEAAVVPCEDQIVIFKNSIDSIKVEVLDADNNNSSIDVTDQLVILGTQQPLSEYIAENNPGIGDLLMEFSDTSNIPDRITYVIEATLDDGQIIRTTGGIINFN